MYYILDPVELFDELLRTGAPDLSRVLPGFHEPHEWLALRHAIARSWRLDLDSAEKLTRARAILKDRIPRIRAEQIAALAATPKKTAPTPQNAAAAAVAAVATTTSATTSADDYFGGSDEMAPLKIDQFSERADIGRNYFVAPLPSDDAQNAVDDNEDDDDDGDDDEGDDYQNANKNREATHKNAAVGAHFADAPLVGVETTTRRYNSIWTTRNWKLLVAPVKSLRMAVAIGASDRIVSLQLRHIFDKATSRRSSCHRAAQFASTAKSAARRSLRRATSS